MSYSWTFKNLRVAAKQSDLDDVMVSVDYRIGYTTTKQQWAYHHGSVTFASADPDAFTAFNDITEDDMIAFVEQSLGSELVEIKAALEQQLLNPVTFKPLPWEASMEDSIE
jgi:hypothetical protein